MAFLPKELERALFGVTPGLPMQPRPELNQGAAQMDDFGIGALLEQLGQPQQEAVQPDELTTLQRVLQSIASAGSTFASGINPNVQAQDFLGQLMAMRQEQADRENMQNRQGFEDRQRSLMTALRVAMGEKAESEADRRAREEREHADRIRLENIERENTLLEQERGIERDQELQGLAALFREAGLTEDDLGKFDLDTPIGRGQAQGFALKRMADAEIAANANAQKQQLMGEAFPVAEIEATDTMLALLQNMPTSGNAAGVRRTLQDEFALTLEKQQALLVSAGFSPEYIRQWVRTKQSRFESLLQGKQASRVKIKPGGKRKPPKTPGSVETGRGTRLNRFLENKLGGFADRR